MNEQRILGFASITLLFFGFIISDAYAYIDPGSGSVIIYALIGVLVGVVFTLKVYWYKFKEKLRSISKKND